MLRTFRAIFAAIVLVALNGMASGAAFAAGHGGRGAGAAHIGGGAHFGGAAHFGAARFGGAHFGAVHIGRGRVGALRFHRGHVVRLRFRHGRRFFARRLYYFHHGCWVRRLVWTRWGLHWRWFNRCRYYRWRYY